MLGSYPKFGLANKFSAVAIQYGTFQNKAEPLLPKRGLFTVHLANKSGGWQI